MDAETFRQTISVELSKIESCILRKTSTRFGDFPEDLPDLIKQVNKNSRAKENGKAKKSPPDILNLVPRAGFSRDFVPYEDRQHLIRRIGSVRGVRNGVVEAIDQLNLQRDWKVPYVWALVPHLQQA